MEPFSLMSVNPLCSNNLTNSENFTKDLGAVFGGSLHGSKSLNESTHYVLRSKTCQPVAFEERKCTGSLVQPPAISQSRGFGQFQLSFRAAPRWAPAPSARSPTAGRAVRSQAPTPSFERTPASLQDGDGLGRIVVLLHRCGQQLMKREGCVSVPVSSSRAAAPVCPESLESQSR